MAGVMSVNYYNSHLRGNFRRSILIYSHYFYSSNIVVTWLQLYIYIRSLKDGYGLVTEADTLVLYLPHIANLAMIILPTRELFIQLFYYMN